MSPNININAEKKISKRNYLYVLPVLLLEFLALALTRAVIPSLLLQTFGDHVYLVMGCAECIRGLLAFVACPLFGKISDKIGRKICLFITVLGTCSPVCSLAVMVNQNTYFYAAQGNDAMLYSSNEEGGYGSSTDSIQDSELLSWEKAKTRERMWIFVVLLALSGIFSSTFTLTFAYISDSVKKKDRVSAYGLALATFGLSFTIGPVLGGYLAKYDNIKESLEWSDKHENRDNMETLESFHSYPLGERRVFTFSFLLVILDLCYIYFVLPESIHTKVNVNSNDDESVSTNDTRSTFSSRLSVIKKDFLPSSWSPLDVVQIFRGDPFMYEVGYIALLYYTSLWAVVSTLTLYAAKRFHLGPDRLGELMSALGLSTMISEGLLVRIIVPRIGEKRCIRIGLVSFVLQCFLLGFANEGWQLFLCVIFSVGGNLVYPSLTSLVSGAVSPDMIGESLGAINGVKALTEGLGPLIFGSLMTISEKSALPGWPYLIASIFAMMAYKRSSKLPCENNEEYISEKYRSNDSLHRQSDLRTLSLTQIELEEERESEITGLLSDIDEIDEYNFPVNNASDE